MGRHLRESFHLDLIVRGRSMAYV